MLDLNMAQLTATACAIEDALKGVDEWSEAELESLRYSLGQIEAEQDRLIEIRLEERKED